MRFVLVGFSVVIATFGIFMYNEHTKTDDNNKKVQDQEQRRSPSTLQSIWSLFNGQFLYKESKRAQNNGGLSYFIFLGTMIILSLLTLLYVILPYFVEKSILSGFCGFLHVFD